VIAWQALFPAYGETLHSYLQLVVSKTTSINRVQLILLLSVGIGACALLSLWTLHTLQAVAEQRHSMYNIFVVGAYSTEVPDR
jgi:hypothetical protein